MLKWKVIFGICVAAGIGLLGYTLFGEAFRTQTTIRVLGEDSSNLDAYSSLAAEFTQKYGAKVVFEKVSFDKLSEKADLDFQKGTGAYDIVLNYNFALAPYVKNNYVVAMGSTKSPTPLRNVQMNEGMFENALKETSFYYSDPTDSKSPAAQFGLPFAANTMLLVYNKELFGDLELQKKYLAMTGKQLAPPTDWPSYIAIAEFFAAARPGLFGVAMQGASGDWLYYEMANYLFGMGTGTSTKRHGWEEARPNLVSAQNEEVLRFMKRLRRTSSGDFFTVDAPKQQTLMLEGKTAMALMWSDYVRPLSAVLQRDGKSPTFGFAPTPGTRSGLAGGAFYINRASKNIDMASQFVLFALSPQIQRKLMDKGLCSPIKTAYTPDVIEKVPYARALYDSLERGVFMFEAGTDATVISSALTTYVQKYMRGELSESEALKQAQAEVMSKQSAVR